MTPGAFPVLCAQPLKAIRQECVAAAETYEPKAPPGVKGNGAIAFGGGAVLTDDGRTSLREVDSAQFDGEVKSEPVAA